MALEFYEAAVASPSGASEGVFIPISDLPGVNAGELANSEPTAKKTAKAVLGLLNAIATNLPVTTLGLAITRGSNSGGLDLTNNVFNITSQLYADHETKTIDVLPVPGTGANSGVGGLSVDTVFPNAAKVAADGAIPSEGMLIPTADLIRHGSMAHGSLTIASDSRLWFQGLSEWLSVNLTTRTPSDASAVTGLTRGNTQPVTLPPSATDSTDPTTDIAANDLNKISIFSHNYSVTIQTKADQTNQTFDVNVVTS